MAKNRGGIPVKKRSGPPRSYEEIINMIALGYDNLSDGFQQVARFFTQNPNIIALESISGIAKKCGTHPSTLVRFAQHFGYSGFKPLQMVFQTRLATAAPGFRERISALEAELSNSSDRGNTGHLKRLVVRDIAALQGLLETIGEAELSSAATLLSKADTIYVAGQLRSEPIGLLMRYLMTMLHRRVILLDSAGGLAPEIATTMTQKDALVAISFRHYAKEVVSISEYAAEAGIPIISITDSQLSPIAKGAHVLFTIPEDEYTFSRTLAAPMCLVQCLAVATAALLQPSKGQTPVILTVTEKVRRRRSGSIRS